MLLVSAIVKPKSNEFATQQPSRSSNGRTRRRLKQTRIERSVSFSGKKCNRLDSSSNSGMEGKAQHLLEDDGCVTRSGE
jgi:hypothetical protein